MTTDGRVRVTAPRSEWLEKQGPTPALGTCPICFVSAVVSCAPVPAPFPHTRTGQSAKSRTVQHAGCGLEHATGTLGSYARQQTPSHWVADSLRIVSWVRSRHLSSSKPPWNHHLGHLCTTACSKTSLACWVGILAASHTLWPPELQQQVRGGLMLPNTLNSSSAYLAAPHPAPAHA